jgi:hypothetical protein
MLKIQKIANPCTIKTGVLASVMALSLVGCRRQPLHQVENPNSYMLEKLDNFTRSDFNKPDTAGLELFKIDTIQVNQKNLENQEDFAKKIKIRARSKNPQVKTKDEWEYGYAIGPRQTFGGFKTKPGLDYHHVTEYEGKYISSSIVANVQNKLFANENETKFYIPVEYYGKPDSTVVEVK